MNAITRILSTLALVTTIALAPACRMDSPDVGDYPEMDEAIDAKISKQEAQAVAETALEGLNDGDYEAWTTQWHESMLNGIPEKDWLEFRGALLDKYGEYEEVLETRITDADTDGYVRFSFLVEFEQGEVMLVHVYPQDGEQITGVLMGRPDGSPL